MSNSHHRETWDPGEIRGLVVLATCREIVDSRFDPELDGDLGIALAALERAGLEARAVAWDDEEMDWETASLVVVRSTWDYHRRLDEFLAWVNRVDRVTRLANAAPVLQWNTDKTYLNDLAVAGLPVIDTVFVNATNREEAVWRARCKQWAVGGDTAGGDAVGGDIVVKPSVSAGSNDTRRHAEMGTALAHIDELVAAGRTAMVQPYLALVDERSETGLVYIDGSFSHAFAKGPMLAAPGHAVGDLYLAESIAARRASAEERSLGDAVMAWLERRFGTVLYARVDMLPTENGPVIIEVELTEPSLYLHLDERAPDKFAEAIARRRNRGVE